MRLEGFSRIRILYIFIFFFAAAIVLRLFFIQVVNGKDYSEAADRQYVTPISHIFDRGSVFFKERNGELASAATLSSGFTIAINPKEIDDAEVAYKKISQII